MTRPEVQSYVMPTTPLRLSLTASVLFCFLCLVIYDATKLDFFFVCKFKTNSVHVWVRTEEDVTVMK